MVERTHAMPISYDYNASERLIEVTCFGELVIDEILQYFEDLHSDPSVPKGAIELVDISQVHYFNVSFEDASSMPEGYVSTHISKEIRATVFFGMKPLNEGLAKLIKAHFANALPQHTFLLASGETEARSTAARIHSEYNPGAGSAAWRSPNERRGGSDRCRE